MEISLSSRHPKLPRETFCMRLAMRGRTFGEQFPLQIARSLSERTGPPLTRALNRYAATGNEAVCSAIGACAQKHHWRELGHDAAGG